MVIFVGILLILAAWQDWKTFRISNKLVLTGIIGSFLFWFIDCGVVGIGNWIMDMGILFIISFPVWALGMFGAGDAKLIIMLGGCFGVTFAIKVLFYALCIGAIISLGKMLYVGNLFHRLQFLCSYISYICIHKKIICYSISETLEKDKVIHFAVPIAIGYFYYICR